MTNQEPPEPMYQPASARPEFLARPANPSAVVPAGIASADQLPAGVSLTSVGKRFGVYLLDLGLIALTFGLGWFVWGAITAANGQTPARQILGVKMVSTRDGRPLSWAQMVFLRGIVGSFIMSLAAGITFGILAFMPLWHRNNQTVNDIVSSSISVDDPNRVYG